MEWFPLIPASAAILYTRKTLLCKDAKLRVQVLPTHYTGH